MKKRARVKNPKPLPRLVWQSKDIRNESFAIAAESIRRIQEANGTREDYQQLSLLIESSDDELNRHFIFENYKGRSRSALDLMLLAGMNEDNPKVRMAAISFCGIAGLDSQISFEDLIELAVHESHPGSLFELKKLINERIKGDTRRKEKIVERLGERLSEQGGVGFELAMMFFSLDQEDAYKLAWQTMLLCSDSYFGPLFEAADEHKQVILDTCSEDTFINMLSDLLKTRLQRNEHFLSYLFDSTIPSIMNIEKLSDLLRTEVGKKLLEFGQPNEFSGDLYLLGYSYLEAALNGSLMKTNIRGQRIKYFVMPPGKLDSVGKFNRNAIGVVGSVPKSLQPLVAYHEYVEQKTDSHDEAVIAEREAARELGVEKEYKEWLSSNGIQKR